MDWCGWSLALRGFCIGGWGRERWAGAVNLDIWPSIAQQVRDQLAQTGLSGLAFPLQTPHPSAQFLLITQKKDVMFVMPGGASLDRRVQGDTDPSAGDAHPYLKASVSDLWVAVLSVVLVSSHPEMDLTQSFWRIFPQITAI